MAALEGARFSRRRTGASAWRVWQDAAEPDRIVEQFIVASWEDHLRQHDRVTSHDEERLAKIRSMTDPDRPPPSPTGSRPPLPIAVPGGRDSAPSAKPESWAAMQGQHASGGISAPSMLPIHK